MSAHEFTTVEEIGPMDETGWRDISTAPRDGARILTYSPAAKKLGYAETRINYWKDGTWWLSNETDWPPSHWMPIPPPPR